MPVTDLQRHQVFCNQQRAIRKRAKVYIDKHNSKERVLDNLSLHHILVFIESRLLGRRGDYDASLSARVAKCEQNIGSLLSKSETDDLNDRVIRLHSFAADDDFMNRYSQ